MQPDSNIDSRINWVDFYSNYFKKTKKTGKNKIMALCPFHQDTKPSFWFNTENGCWKCEACGESGNGQTFIEKVENIDSKEAYKKLRQIAGINTDAKPKQTKKYTMEDYCTAKCLPLEFIASLGVKNAKIGITIPYMDESGAVVSNRQRLGNGQGPRFTWTRGSKVSLYGLWLLSRIREMGFVVLVEGESDSHTLWYHKIPALGVPGASTFQSSWTQYLKGLKIYIHKEPDLGGETFLKKVCQGLYEGKFEGEVFQISTPGHKDPSELHINELGNFNDRWNAAINMAQKLDIQEICVDVDTLFDGCPIQLRQATGWIINERGIHYVNPKDGNVSCIIKTPVILSRRMKSLDTGEEKIEIMYKRDGGWHSAIYQRSTIFQSRTIVQLSDLGITVTSENAKMLVKFLGALESENIDILKKTHCTTQLGWYGKNFLPCINGDIAIDVDFNSQKWVNGYRKSGSFDKWKENISPYRSNIIFRFILASCFAAPLLKVLNHRIFLIHNWGDSRSGKTAALKGALSVWGNPEELMANFNATAVGIERLAAFYNDLPLAIDEKQVAGNRQDFLEKLVYMLSLGSTKVRGSKAGGLQSQRSWRSIVLTTGEEPLTIGTSQTGVHTRTLEIQGSPFNSENEARQMHDISINDYGHAGEEFIKGLLDKDWEVLKDKQKVMQEEFAVLYPDKLGSHLSSVAAVTLADILASEIIFGETNEEKSKEMAISILDLLEDNNEADITDNAYEFIQSWVISNANQFSKDAKTRYGFVDPDEDEKHTFYIFPHIMEKALAEQGYSYRKIIKTLGERNLIGCSYNNDKKRYSVMKRFGDIVGRFIEIKFEEIEESAPF